MTRSSSATMQAVPCHDFAALRSLRRVDAVVVSDYSRDTDIPTYALRSIDGMHLWVKK